MAEGIVMVVVGTLRLTLAIFVLMVLWNGMRALERISNNVEKLMRAHERMAAALNKPAPCNDNKME